MTLRQLLWAADGRQRSDWGRFASVIASIGGIWGGRVDPQTCIPKRYRDKQGAKSDKSELQKEHENRIAWALLDSFFRGGKARERKQSS